VLHGEQYTELKRPLPTHGKLTTRGTVKSIYDKQGSGRQHRVRTYDESATS